MSKDLENLKRIAAEIRFNLVQISHRTGTPHLGGSLSCVDILVALYWTCLKIDLDFPENLERDRFLLSKGHAAPSLFTTLAWRGFFPKEDLLDYAKPGSPLEEHPAPYCVKGVEIASGSLGHGLSIGLGMALGAKVQNKLYRVAALLSDGECNEGAVWEAAMFAPVHKLDNLLAVVDFNQWQATGRSREVMALEPLVKKWEAFGWNAWEVDGHDMSALVDVLTKFPSKNGKPTVIIANTVKGKGVSFMEDDNNWHYRIPTAEEVEKARVELGVATP